MDANVTLDAVGLYCPVPVMLTTEKIKELEKGEVLEVMTDDPDSLEDIPGWCKIAGHRFMKMSKNEGIYRFYIQKEAAE
ncbi:MAG: sulfurtransferase TusA family protein [Candidatus Desantisbacteria bacterium]